VVISVAWWQPVDSQGSASLNQRVMSAAGKKKKKKADEEAAEEENEREVPISEMDLFGAGAMNSAYLICHNVQDFLFCRGYRFPRAPKKAKKKRGKKR